MTIPDGSTSRFLFDPSPKGSNRRISRRFTWRFVAVAVAVVGLLALIGFLSADVKTVLNKLKIAEADKGQWAINQSEVEVLQLRLAVEHALGHPNDRRALAEVRRWFDVAYSRFQVLNTSQVYASVIDLPPNQERIDRIQDLLNQSIPDIDANDSALAEALPRLEVMASDVHAAARDLVLTAHKNLSQTTDQNSGQMERTLISIAVASTTLMIVLIILSVMLAHLYRLTSKQAEINQITGTRLQMTIANSPDAIIVTNRGGWAVEFNPAAEAMFGLHRENVINSQIIPLIFASDDVAAYQQQISAALAKSVSSGPQRFELVAKRRDGSSFPIEVSLASRNLVKGALIVAFIRDITNRKSNEAALNEALVKARAGEKAKADFLAVMSHEMRTPLNGLLGSADLLRSTTLSNEQTKLLSVIETSGNLLLGHVNSVLDIARAEAGEIRLIDEPFDLDRLIADCIDNQHGLAQKNGTTLRHIPLTGDFGLVRGDALRLQQILLNLIGNAVKFTHNGSITLETERIAPKAAHGRPGIVEFRVIDTGIGIAEPDLDRIFEDFETLDSSYGRKAGGTGLGLGIARRLTKVMAGTIGVESELGEGSVFWIRVPLRPAQVKLAAVPSPEKDSPAVDAPKASGLDILIIEDNDINRFLLRRFLEEAGHKVTETIDGVEGLHAAETNYYDVILTDISMPRMDGVETTRRIRAGSGPSARSRIIALTAHALPAELSRFAEVGMNACLTKPISREVLMSHVNGTANPDSEPAAPGSQPLLDPAPLQELVDELGADLMHSLASRLIAEADTTVAALVAFETATAEMARQAHQLAGGCATFGTKRLREVLATIENNIKRDDGDGALAAAASLPDLWSKTRSALQAELTRLAS
ncbi:ATP-binding protein [Thioclava sp. FR2]|uniref:ATP-binding protein n=1 Tax=Thioclava sp. FR2 TaxID=3445780 RepID=UPI003EB7FDDB